MGQADRDQSPLPDFAGDSRVFDAPAGVRITELALELQPLDLIVQWRRCSLAAEFVASYLVYLFEHRAGARQILSAAINELVENLARYAADKRAQTRLGVLHHGEVLRVSTQNHATPASARALATRLGRLAEEDPELLFLEQLEHTASEDPSASGLGLLTLRKDYGARLGARFEPVGAEVRVTLTLELDTEVIEQS